MAISPERLAVLHGRVTALQATNPASPDAARARDFLADTAPALIAELRRIHQHAQALNDVWEQREEEALDNRNHTEATTYRQAREDLAGLLDGTLPEHIVTEKRGPRP
ncbi:MAG TPA: hypothetical protein VFY14_00455 [Streptomyces sp.]|nr:hypothetical protein [Streptomyces sp.]